MVPNGLKKAINVVLVLLWLGLAIMGLADAYFGGENPLLLALASNILFGLAILYAKLLSIEKKMVCIEDNDAAEHEAND